MEEGCWAWDSSAPEDMERQAEAARERQERQERELAAARRQFSRLGGMYFLGTMVIFAVQYAASFAVGILCPQWLWNGDFVLLLSMLPMYLIGMPVLIILVRTIPAEREIGRASCRERVS